MVLPNCPDPIGHEQNGHDLSCLRLETPEEIAAAEAEIDYSYIDIQFIEEGLSGDEDVMDFLDAYRYDGENGE